MKLFISIFLVFSKPIFANSNPLIFFESEIDSKAGKLLIDTCNGHDEVFKRPKTLFIVSEDKVIPTIFVKNESKKVPPGCEEKPVIAVFSVFKFEPQQIEYPYLVIDKSEVRLKNIENQFSSVKLTKEFLEGLKINLKDLSQTPMESLDQFRTYILKECHSVKFHQLTKLICPNEKKYLFLDKNLLDSGDIDVKAEVIIDNQKYYLIRSSSDKGSFDSLVPSHGKSISPYSCSLRTVSC